jgi:glycerol-3-phosphate acyltransferase PlsY
MNLNTGLLPYLLKSGSDFAPLIFYFSMFAVLLVSYMLGSVNASIVISRVLYHDDIRTKGSGNAGMTNMLRTYGGKAALLTLFGDLLKTSLPVFITGLVFGFGYIGGAATQELCYVSGLLAVIGHVFPLWYKFKGGKGVLATATVFLMLCPAVFAAMFILFVAIVAASKYVSLGSVCSAMLLPVALHGYFKWALNGQPFGLVTLSAVLIAILVVWCHRGNIVRISNRTERKLSFGKKNKEEDGEK